MVPALVPETTLLPSYPERANFSLKSLKDSTNRLYDPARVVTGSETTRVHGRVVSSWQAGRETLTGGTTFSH